MNGLQIADVDDLKANNPNLKIQPRGYRFMDYIAWNLDNPLFSDKRVRQALAYGSDMDAIIDKLLTSKTGEKHAKRTVSTVTPELCSVYNDEITPFPHDVEKAKALLAEAGWKDTNGNGTLDKGGKEFTFTLLTNRENQRRLETSQILQKQFKELGIGMEISTIEFGTLTDRAKRREFEAFLSGWSAALLVDPSDVWQSETPGHPREFNYPNYSNPKVDELIGKGLSTPDPAEAAPIWREMQALIYDDQAYLFLFSRNEFVAIDSRFENTSIDILSEFHHLERWSVPEDKVKYKF
jgi:peptide/nickel transport system substrate-binding protein